MRRAVGETPRERLLIHADYLDRCGRQNLAADLRAVVPPEEGTEAADVLDRMANPHPRMWAEAKDVFAARHGSPEAMAWWNGALQMMCAATGYEPSYFIEKLNAEL